MRTRAIAVMTVLGLLFGATAVSAAERYDADDAVDTDSLDFEVELACPTDPDDLPDGVTGVGRGGDGNYYYIAPTDDDVIDNFAHGVYVTPAFEVGFGDTALVVVEGNAYYTLPNNHAWYDIVYVLEDGTTHTAGATFDDEGCMTDFGWEVNTYAPQVEFRDSDGVAPVAAPVDAQVGNAVELSVASSNPTGPNAYGSSLDEGWWLGLEVGAFQYGESVVIEVCEADFTDCAEVASEVFTDGGSTVVQVELSEADVAAALDQGDETVLHFRATFAETGQFTGEVFLFGDAALYGADL